MAEGVESRLAWEELRSVGCDYAQGYFLSRPVPAMRLPEWLATRRVELGLG